MKATRSRLASPFKYTKIFSVQDIQGKDEEAQQLLEDQILAECDNYTPPSPAECRKAEGCSAAGKPTSW